VPAVEATLRERARRLKVLRKSFVANRRLQHLDQVANLHD
jgi:hypothetical protein